MAELLLDCRARFVASELVGGALPMFLANPEALCRLPQGSCCIGNPSSGNPHWRPDKLHLLRRPGFFKSVVLVRSG